MAAGHLVALGQLAPLGHRHAHHLVHARRQVAVLVAGEDLDVDDLALFTVRQAQRGVLHFARLFAKDGPQQLLFRRQLFLTLGRDLAHQDIVGAHFGAHPDDAVLVEVLEGVLADVGDVVSDFFRSELGIPRLHLILFDVDRGELVLAHEPLGDQDGVFVVAALPGHKGHQNVVAQRQLAVIGRRRVGNDLALHHALALGYGRALVDAGALVGAVVFSQPVGPAFAVALQHDLAAGHRHHFAVFLGHHHLA